MQHNILKAFMSLAAYAAVIKASCKESLYSMKSNIQSVKAESIRSSDLQSETCVNVFHAVKDTQVKQK